LQRELGVEAIFGKGTKVKRAFGLVTHTHTKSQLEQEFQVRGAVHVDFIWIYYIVPCMNETAWNSCQFTLFFVGFWVLPRKRLAAHPLPPGDGLFLPSFLGSFLNCLAVKQNRQAMHGGGHCFITFFNKLGCIGLQNTPMYVGLWNAMFLLVLWCLWVIMCGC